MRKSWKEISASARRQRRQWKLYVGPCGHGGRIGMNDCEAEAKLVGRARANGVTLKIGATHTFVTGYEGKTRQCRVCMRVERLTHV